jgi:glycosyltransferase involved in cell wall biosynthesis
MLFDFLKYLQPTHYFQLCNNLGTSIFPIKEKLPNHIVRQLKTDSEYESLIATNYDLSWQAIKRGYIGTTATYTSFENVSIKDNYRFLRKNFNSAWVFFVFIIRLFSFHNPFKELNSWISTRGVRRANDYNNPICNPKWTDFKSDLVYKNFKVSIVVPTLNRYDYLNDVLKDFECQDYKNFEVIIVDQSEPFNAEFYKKYNLDINLIRQKEKALWLARNTAIKNSKGKFIVLSEDDVRVEPNWITQHLKCLDYFEAQVSAGVFYPEGKTIPKERSFFAIASQFATGNAMLYKDVFKKVGLFDRQFEKQRMGDGEFGMRIYLEGIKSISNPLASCIDVKARTGGLREMGSWDAFRPSNFFAPRPIPSVLYYFRRYFGNKPAIMAILRNVPLSIFPYQFKKNKPLLILGVLVSILMLPIVCFQVYKSWHLSSQKIQTGPIIEHLE